jgi:hypothetical protein
MALTFDPATRRIVLDSASITATELYSRWVDWVATGDNAKYQPAFRSVGGDDLGGGLSIPPYFFLQNGWRVRPMEANQTLTITGNLFVDGGGDPVVSTLGTFNVLTKLVVPVQAQGITTSGSSAPTASEVATAVWGHASAVDLLSRVQLAEAILRNKQVTDPVTGIMTVFDVDGVTPLLQAQLYEGIDTLVPYRGSGAERRERLA